jgi:hypothetical protein
MSTITAAYLQSRDGDVRRLNLVESQVQFLAMAALAHGNVLKLRQSTHLVRH